MFQGKAQLQDLTASYCSVLKYCSKSHYTTCNFSLCSVNVFNCGTLTEFLQLLPVPNTMPNLCIYITQAELLEASFPLPLEMSHWCRTHEAPANQMPLCTGKGLAAFTGVSFHVHFRCCSSSCVLKSAQTSGKVLVLAPGTLTTKNQGTTEGHFSVQSFSFGLFLLHCSNV